ncbi:hypothetical protein C8J57DRAFT_1405432 [Mycena rebaudengoi]|nr:hypothetical protein C8J57DRAFT_1405432 [Mycena rebaudengoi]
MPQLRHLHVNLVTAWNIFGEYVGAFAPSPPPQPFAHLVDISAPYPIVAIVVASAPAVTQVVVNDRIPETTTLSTSSILSFHSRCIQWPCP